MPIPLSLFSLIMLLTVHNHDTLVFLIQRKDEVGSINLIDKLYPDESIFRREELRSSLEHRYLTCTCNSQKSVSMVDSLTDGNYKRATFMCLALALFNQLSGVNVITFYST